jgi:hypothetical protein
MPSASWSLTARCHSSKTWRICSSVFALLVFVYRRVAFGAAWEMWAVMRTLPRRAGLPE